jgi:hypothetical protein
VIFRDLAFAGLAEPNGSAQLSLQPGYNAIAASAERARVLVAAIRELLFATSSQPEPTAAAGLGANPPKMAATLVGAPEAVFRIVRDLGRGSVQLSEYSSATHDFRSVSAEAVEADRKSTRLNSSHP